jgi:hypothetical protein
MTLGKLAEFIERKMKGIEPGLNPKDRARWLWGYHDALEDVMKEMKEGKK